MSVLNTNHKSPVNLDDEEPVTTPATLPPAADVNKLPAEPPGNPAESRLKDFATRGGLAGKQGGEKTKLIMLGGSVLIALLFLMFAQFGTKAKKSVTPETKPTEAQKQAAQSQQHASNVPVMDPVHLQQQDQNGERVSPNDIARTKKPAYESGAATRDNATGGSNRPPHSPASSQNLGSVPPFKETQQQWENPAPYRGENASSASSAQQEANALKEASLVYVRNLQQGSSGQATATPASDGPVLQLQEGTRISARLDTQISTDIHAPVVAVVEYTYAIGDQVMVPAGARVYGKLTQAEASGVVGVDFDEIELLDGAREKITAIGEGLDLGPIKGDVYGRHDGRNFLIRALSGIGSTAAMLVGNNNSGAYSMSDSIRERAADNLGMASDAQLMTLNANTHITVCVPANTRIYIVWTARPKAVPSKASTQATTVPANTIPQ
jgi:hypothetical protein